MQRLWRKGPLVVSSPPATPPSAIRWYVDRKLLEVPMRCLLWGERIGAAGPRLHYSNELSSPPPLPLPPDWSTEDEGLEATPQILELSSVEAKRLGGRGFTRSFEQPAPLPGGSAGHCRWLREQRTLFTDISGTGSTRQSRGESRTATGKDNLYLLARKGDEIQITNEIKDLEKKF